MRGTGGYGGDAWRDLAVGGGDVWEDVAGGRVEYSYVLRMDVHAHIGTLDTCKHAQIQTCRDTNIHRHRHKHTQTQTQTYTHTPYKHTEYTHTRTFYTEYRQTYSVLKHLRSTSPTMTKHNPRPTGPQHCPVLRTPCYSYSRSLAPYSVLRTPSSVLPTPYSLPPSLLHNTPLGSTPHSLPTHTAIPLLPILRNPID